MKFTNQYNILSFFPDPKILERQTLLESTIDALDLEHESYNTSKLFTWVFYLIFIVLTFFQVVSFHLYNGVFHPFSKILDGTDDNWQKGGG